MLTYIACLCPNLVSVHFYAIPILHFKFHLLVHFGSHVTTCTLYHIGAGDYEQTFIQLVVRVFLGL